MSNTRFNSQQAYQFKPLNIGRFLVWSLYALILAVVPLVFTSSLSHTMLSQMGIAIIVCLSYNMLLGTDPALRVAKTAPRSAR